MEQEDKIKMVKDIADKLGVSAKDLTNSVYVLLDRSGSMSSLWGEAISGVNTYMNELDPDTNIYFAIFDSSSYDVVREGVNKNVKRIDESEFSPRSCTPLYDSAAKMFNQMLTDNPNRAVAVIMTDGYENASREFTRDKLLSLKEKVEAKNWPIVFLGANFDQAEAYGTTTFDLARGATANFYDEVNTGFSMTAMKTSAYFSSGDTRNMVYSDEEKASLKSKSEAKKGS